MLPKFDMSNFSSKVRVARVAEGQWGRIAWRQLGELGVPKGTIRAWIDEGYLFPRLPRVYAVGHQGNTTESTLAEALLYAGPGAMLSHATAAWWVGLIEQQPHQIHVSTHRQTRSIHRIRVHQRRRAATGSAGGGTGGLERVWHKRLPTTTLPQTLIDLAAKAPVRTVRKALANADYRDVLDLEAFDALLGRGRPGSARLRQALERHRPELALTKSRLEVMFFEICEEQGWELPEPNEYVAGWQIDALWRDRRIAVELDGHGNHHSPAQRKRDRQKDLELRAAGLMPVRYSGEQLERRDEVVADLERLRNGT
jgi:predicted transcriptional regulator of viral defense system